MNNKHIRISSVQVIMRLEGLALLVLSFVLFMRLGLPVWLYPALLFVPDIGMAGYLVSSRAGAVTYNLMHTLSLPVVLGLIGITLSSSPVIAAALIWAGHIGMDHAIGYGLKYTDTFTHTHLQEL